MHVWVNALVQLDNFWGNGEFAVLPVYCFRGLEWSLLHGGAIHEQIIYISERLLWRMSEHMTSIGCQKICQIECHGGGFTQSTVCNFSIMLSCFLDLCFVILCAYHFLAFLGFIGLHPSLLYLVHSVFHSSLSFPSSFSWFKRLLPSSPLFWANLFSSGY